jgi:hypothetical protein
MSKFLLNLFVQISKALVYSEIQFLIRKGLLLVLGPASVFSPAAAHLHFLSPTGLLPPPSPLGLSRLTARSAQWATRWWRPACLPPPSRGDASSRAAFAPLHARLIGGPHLSSLTSGSARARRRRHRLPPLPTPPSTTPRDVARAVTRPNITPPLIPPLTSPRLQ